MSSYDNLDAMAADDTHIQRNVTQLMKRLCPEAQQRLKHLHVYPSLQCTYTLDKRRVFVCPRDPSGALLSDCALQYVIMHELAHVLNQHSVGHDRIFDQTLQSLDNCLHQNNLLSEDKSFLDPCPNQVPADYNETCRRR